MNITTPAITKVTGEAGEEEEAGAAVSVVLIAAGVSPARVVSGAVGAVVPVVRGLALFAVI